MDIFTALFLLINVIGILDIILVLKILYGIDMETNWKTFSISAIIYYFAGLVLSFYEIKGTISSEISMFYTIGFILLMILIFSKKHYITNILLTFPAILTYTQWVQIIRMFEKLFRLDQYCFYIQDTKITPFYFFEDISLFLLLLYLERKGVKKHFQMRLTLWEGVFVTIFCLFCPVLTTVLDRLDEHLQYPYFSACWVTFVLAVNGTVIYAIAHRKKARYYHNKSEQYKQQFDEEYHYFQQYKTNNKDVAKFRHDWNNHAMVLQSMLQAEEYDKVTTYFEQLCSMPMLSVKKILTGNETLDTVLAVKQNILEQENIATSYNGIPLDISFMEPVDICTLFSNLVDNAIEACKKCNTNRYLQIHTSKNEHILFIVLKNTRKETEKIEGILPKTTKKKKEKHGYGLKNALEIVEKYNGKMEVNGEEEIFTIRLLFPIH